MVASTADQPRDNDPLILVRPTLSRIAEFESLEADWDSYGAAPPTSVARREAQRWVEIVASLFGSRAGKLARPYSVAPLADGGVQLEWRGRGGAVELEVGPEGELGYLLKEKSGAQVSCREADNVSWSDVLRILIRVLTP